MCSSDLIQRCFIKQRFPLRICIQVRCQVCYFSGFCSQLDNVVSTIENDIRQISAGDKKFDETSLDFNTVDGKIYGIPVSKEVSYIYYNKDLFEQAGIEAPEVAYATWDEFFEACDKLKEAGITPIGMDSADSGWLTNLWMSALIGTNGDAGNEWMNTMYPTDYNTPEVIESAENIQ